MKIERQEAVTTSRTISNVFNEQNENTNVENYLQQPKKILSNEV